MNWLGKTGTIIHLFILFQAIVSLLHFSNHRFDMLSSHLDLSLHSESKNLRLSRKSQQESRFLGGEISSENGNERDWDADRHSDNYQPASPTLYLIH